MSDELDAKLARISARMDDRAKVVRDELSAIGALALAELCRDVFGARLTYLKTPRVEFGSNPFPHPGCVWTPYLKPKVKYAAQETDSGKFAEANRRKGRGRVLAVDWRDQHAWLRDGDD